MKKVLTFVFICFCLVGAVSAQTLTHVVRPDVPSFVGFVQDEVIIKFKADANPLDLNRKLAASTATGVADFDAIGAQFGVTNFRKQFTEAGAGSLSRYYAVKFQVGTIDEVMTAYRNHPLIEKVEPIGIHTVYATPNDGNYAGQWHLNRANDHDVDAPEAWDNETGDPAIIVALMDTGVRYYHKDLGGSAASSTTPTAAQGNMWINTAEKNGVTGVDDDSNGYVDDWIGYDWVTATSSCWSGEDCSTPDNDPRDFNGHGTHCAGNIAAMNNNGYGTCAVSGGWGTGTNTPTGNGARVMALRVGWSAPYLGIYEVGYVRMDFAASAFYYAARNGAKIASCSWGSSNSGGLAEAVDTFLARGGIIYKAAGNDGTQTADYLCARTDIQSVAATDSNDCKADFSTYGTWVDISAPGTGILSSYHDHANPANDYVAAMDGTSMATPIVASVAALVWSRHPTWTATEVVDRVELTADPLTQSCNTSYAGRLGAGRVNAFNAVNDGPTCDVVANFSGTPTTGCAPLNVTFTDLSTGPVTSWNWTFGDGGTSTAQNPSHAYAAAGTYSVALTVTSAICNNTMTKTGYVVVSTTPAANFTGTPTSGNAPLAVTFTNQSTGGATTWAWTFGDGGTSTAQNPSYTYTTAGTYSVSLTASNACGSNQFTRSNYITVSTPPAQQCDDFADGNITNWVNSLGTWTVSAGAMKGNSNTTDARRTSPFGSFTTATIDCDVRMNTGRNQRNARIIFNYVNSTTYRFIEADDLNNRWRIYERTGGTNTVRATFNQTLSSATWYHVQVTVASNGLTTLRVGGTPVLTYTFATVPSGLVGCGFTRSNSDFDNFCVGSAVSGAAAFAGNDASVSDMVTLPDEISLDQNYPNPFNPTTSISFNLSTSANVSLEIFNILGEKVNTLMQGMVEAGHHEVVWNSTNENGTPVASGVYFYRLNAGERVVTKKMLLLK